VDNTENILKRELESHGAREFEMVALSMDPHRGLAALHYAVSKNANNPVTYAIAVFDNPDWQPSGGNRRQAQNQSVDITCPQCGGDRFVPVEQGEGLYEETYAPCKACNGNANTVRWVGNERRVTVAR